jgi:hypothetical protein
MIIRRLMKAILRKLSSYNKFRVVVLHIINFVKVRYGEEGLVNFGVTKQLVEEVYIRQVHL